MYLLFLILLLAVVSDLSLGRIPNYLTLGGLVASQIWIYRSDSVYSALFSLAGALLIICAVFPLFAMGCLGGGDVKLLMSFPAFVGLKNAFVILWYSLLAAALIGSAKLILAGRFRERMRGFLLYLYTVIRTGKPVRYMTLPAAGGMAVNQIHFSLPILLGTMIFSLKNYLLTHGGTW